MVQDLETPVTQAVRVEHRAANHHLQHQQQELETKADILQLKVTTLEQVQLDKAHLTQHQVAAVRVEQEHKRLVQRQVQVEQATILHQLMLLQLQPESADIMPVVVVVLHTQFNLQPMGARAVAELEMEQMELPTQDQVAVETLTS
jgi:hypothetical protein